MKVTFILLIASLAANGVLLYRSQRPGSGPASSAVEAKPAGHAAGAPSGNSSAAKPQASKAMNATSFAALLAGDLGTMVATLQAAHFSPEVIRAIVKYRVAQQFQGRLDALAAKDIPYWSSPSALGHSEYGLEKAAIEKAMSAQIVALLGNDYATPAEELAARKEFDYLPPEKQAAAMRLVADFAQRIQAAGQAGESSAALGFERREALAKLLSPEEYEQYNLRNASTSTVLRNRMRAFEPTEQEYLAIFRLERPIAEKYGGTGGPERQAEVQALQGPIAAALGPERYAEYQLKITPQYIALDGLTKRLDLPAASISTTLGIQQEVQQTLTQINRDSSLTPAVRQQALAAVVSDAESRLTPVLGATGVAAYKASGMGSWLNNGGRGGLQGPILLPATALPAR